MADSLFDNRKASVTQRYSIRVERRIQHRLLKRSRAQEADILASLKSCDPHDVASDVAHELTSEEAQILLSEHPDWFTERLELQYASDLLQGISLLDLARRHLERTLLQHLRQQGYQVGETP